MKHITRDHTKPTMMSAEKGRLHLNLGQNVSSAHTEVLVSIIDEIMEELGHKTFKGRFSFEGDFVQITLDDGDSKHTWIRPVN